MSEEQEATMGPRQTEAVKQFNEAVDTITKTGRHKLTSNTVTSLYARATASLLVELIGAIEDLTEAMKESHD